MIVLKSPQEIEKMRSAGQIVAEILDILRSEVRAGVTTLFLDGLAESEARKRKAVAAFKGYGGFPYALCCSLNEQVVHGMPSKRELVEGDIVSLDFGVVYSGYYADAAITVPVSKVTAQAERLVKVTEESLYCAIEAAVPGNRLSDISHAVQAMWNATDFQSLGISWGTGSERSFTKVRRFRILASLAGESG